MRTRETYAFLLTRFILPELGSRVLGDLTSAEVRVWHARHAARHSSSAAKAYRLLSTILRTAVSDGEIDVSPCRVRGAGVEHAPERPTATVQDIHRIREAMIGRLRIVVDLATWCQLRRGEILGLERRDVDVDGNALRIERSRTFLTTGRPVTKDVKTPAGRRTLAVPSPVMRRLTDHLDQFVDIQPNASVVVGADGLPVSAMALQRAWSRARARAGRADLHLHDLRHTGLTLAAATGATTAELMHRAGHASHQAALRYQHASLERDRTLASRLAEYYE